MTARDEILAALPAVRALTGTEDFTAQDVVDELARRRSAYAASTIRTHVASRMCADAPDHHARVYDDLKRTGPGRAATAHAARDRPQRPRPRHRPEGHGADRRPARRPGGGEGRRQNLPEPHRGLRLPRLRLLRPRDRPRPDRRRGPPRPGAPQRPRPPPGLLRPRRSQGPARRVARPRPVRRRARGGRNRRTGAAGRPLHRPR